MRARTPLRISFAGGGTDVSPFPETEGGAVLSATIDRYVLGSLAVHADSHLRIESRDYGISVQLAPDEGFQLDGNLDLIKAALRRGWRDGPNGYGIILSSSAPPGSGLGASSAMVVTVVAMLNEYYGMPMGEYEVAHLASVIEREDMNIAGGLQDYYAAAFGGFNYIEFGRQVVVNPLRVRDYIIGELEMNLVLCFTGGTRRSDHIISDQTERYTRSEVDATEGLRAAERAGSGHEGGLAEGAAGRFRLASGPGVASQEEDVTQDQHAFHRRDLRGGHAERCRRGQGDRSRRGWLHAALRRLREPAPGGRGAGTARRDRKRVLFRSARGAGLEALDLFSHRQPVAVSPLDAVFLDRDGTINVKAPEGSYICSPAQLRLLPRAGKAVRALNDAGIPGAGRHEPARSGFREDELGRRPPRERGIGGSVAAFRGQG